MNITLAVIFVVLLGMYLMSARNREKLRLAFHKVTRWGLIALFAYVALNLVANWLRFDPVKAFIAFLLSRV